MAIIVDAVQYRDLIETMLQFPKPIIAAVAGPALAGGAGLVLASDIVVAGNSATFGLPEPKRGLVAGVVAPLVAFPRRRRPRLRLCCSLRPIRSVPREASRSSYGLVHETGPGRQSLGASRRDCQPVRCRRTRGFAAHQADAERNHRRAFGDTVVRRRGRQRHRPHDRSRRRRLGRVLGKAAPRVEVTEASRCNWGFDAERQRQPLWECV